MNKLLLVDGNALMHRSYHALPAFTTESGFPTNIIFGFFSILHKAISDFNPGYVLVCFDTPAPTFRNKLSPSYQAQRPKIEDDFIRQIPAVKNALTAGKIQHIEKDGYEADDLIGTVALLYQKKKIDVLILSGDKDILQLVNDHVYMVSPQIGFAKTKIYTPEEVLHKMGVLPTQIPDYKALSGDPSDNYPGAKGIGPKTAAKLLKEYHTLQSLMEHLDTVKEERIRSILKTYKNDVLLARQLSEIKTDVPVQINFEKSTFIGFDENLRPFLTEYELYSIINRLFGRTIPQSKQRTNQVESQQSLF